MGNIFTKRNICKISISLLGFSFLLIFSLSYAQTAHAQFDFGNFNIWNLGAKIIISPTPGGGLGYNFIEGIGGDLIGTNAFAGITTTAGVVNADIGRVMDDISSDFKSIFGSESSLAIEAVSELYGTDLIPLTFDEILLDPFGSLTSPTVLAVPNKGSTTSYGTAKKVGDVKEPNGSKSISSKVSGIRSVPYNSLTASIANEDSEPKIDLKSEEMSSITRPMSALTTPAVVVIPAKALVPIKSPPIPSIKLYPKPPPGVGEIIFLAPRFQILKLPKSNCAWAVFAEDRKKISKKEKPSSD